MCYLVLRQEVLVVGGVLITYKDTVGYLKRTMSFHGWIVNERLAEVLATLFHRQYSRFLRAKQLVLLASKLCCATQFDHIVVFGIDNELGQRQI